MTYKGMPTCGTWAGQVVEALQRSTWAGQVAEALQQSAGLAPACTYPPAKAFIAALLLVLQLAVACSGLLVARGTCHPLATPQYSRRLRPVICALPSLCTTCCSCVKCCCALSLGCAASCGSWQRLAWGRWEAPGTTHVSSRGCLGPAETWAACAQLPGRLWGTPLFPEPGARDFEQTQRFSRACARCY